MRYQSNFPGTMDGATDAATWLRDVAAREHLPEALTFALEVCLEELATNVVRHGGSGQRQDGSDRAKAPAPLSMQVTLVPQDDAVELEIEDNGTPFDVSQAPAKPIRRPLDEIAPGGLGMQLIRSFSSEMHYRPVPGGNRIILRFMRHREGVSRAAV